LSDLRNTSARKAEGEKESNEERVAGVFIKKERAGLDYAKDMTERMETLKYKSVSKRERKKKKEIRPGTYNRILIAFSVIWSTCADVDVPQNHGPRSHTSTPTSCLST
jgi:hypothetical protein